MIKYEGTENRYFYNTKDVDNILQLINSGNYYGECSREKVTEFVNAVNTFMSNIKSEEQKVILERHETEDEARLYFGQDFIDNFDKLLTILDQQKTIVALHGTMENVCPSICENGLQYKFPSLSSTAVQQEMNYGQRDMHYQNYESLLNWGHKNYKGLVIVAVPYECYYKEGLWNHFADTDAAAYGGQDYRIDPDFIVGYIDVTEKKIVVNPKYNRQHNYSGYETDAELFHKKDNMDNDKLTQLLIDSKKMFEKESSEFSENKSNIENKPEKLEISRIPYIIEDLTGTFNSIKMGFPDGMSESRYKHLLEELSYGFTGIQEILPLLKTNEELKKEQEQKYLVFNQSTASSSESKDESFDFDWGEDINWGTPIEEFTKSSRRL